MNSRAATSEILKFRKNGYNWETFLFKTLDCHYMLSLVNIVWFAAQVKE